MRVGKSFTKRLISLLLCAVMVFGLVPALTPATEAAPVDESGNPQDYITMPITIRDYAADGMLFEFNQVGATGTMTVGESTTYDALINPSSWSASSYGGIRVQTYGKNTWTDTSLYWHCLICDSNGNVVKVIPSNTAKGSASSGAYASAMKSGYYSVWAWVSAGSAYDAIKYITETNKSLYRVTYSSSGTITIYVKGDQSGTYNQADTAGFSLLATTDGKDYIHNLIDSSSIAGTDLIQNGTWGLKTDPDPITATLNSGATQQVFGAWIRTNLVEPELDAEGRMVYTKDTVDYLANYMQQIMNVPWQNADGSYNTYFVKGHKLTELRGSDLADVIRQQVIAKGNQLGTYRDAKVKFEDEKLVHYSGIETWYDAAYFLLHNTFRDSQGYGRTIGEYNSLQLVASTNSEGEPCYVFNSGYDDTEYDPVVGEIYNKQTSEIIGAYAKDATSPTYVRGNLLPAARFDPLGPSGLENGQQLGYGMSGDTYGDMITESAADWNEYYDETNYHLTMETHAQFIYYYDDELYFTFTGDDDVYLFVNGTRILDLGAAHSISKVRVNLNEVAAACGLEDGQAYDFDFFYMERHGTAANFGIETNIKIVDPSMLTEKTGYQNGVEVGYNGFVDPSLPVNYCFELTNNGKAPLRDLWFVDETIGVSLKPTALDFKAETTVNDLLLAVYDANGRIKQYVPRGSLSETALKQALEIGLEIGDRILIHGFKYTIPENKWVQNGTSYYFPNTVHTTGTAVYEDFSTKELHGIANYRVQKPVYSFGGDHFYTVGELADGTDNVILKDPSKIINGISEAEILEMINAGVNVETEAKINIASFDNLKICSASGNTEANYNDKAVVVGNTITYTTGVTGSDHFYFIAESGGTTYGPIHVTVYNYGFADNAYVLDYNLPVELNGTNFGMTKNDQVNADNPFIDETTLTLSVEGMDEEKGELVGTYGTFKVSATAGSSVEDCYGGKSLKYTMTDFMSGVDTANVNVTLAEKNVAIAAVDNRTNGVRFTEKVDVVPANVVYYEDDFVGITYVSDGGNGEWAEYRATDENGNLVVGTEQSADQDSNYGSDPNYDEDVVYDPSGTIKLKLTSESEAKLKAATNENLEDYTNAGSSTQTDSLFGSLMEILGKEYGSMDGSIPGDASNGTLHVLEVLKGSGNGNVMSFEFTGTGFELIGRVTDEAYAVLTVLMSKWDETKNDWVQHKVQPVITENTGGDLYQIPFLAIKNQPHAKYKVELYTSNASSVDRIVYIDGVRIYEPLEDVDELTYYNPTEYNADFIEFKEAIMNGNIAFASATTIGSGTTMIENTPDGGTTLKTTSDITEYLRLGPNNEIYMDSAEMIGFYLKETELEAGQERTIQIGAHRKVDESTDASAVAMAYASTYADAYSVVPEQFTGVSNKNYVVVNSGTEQYHTIDPQYLKKADVKDVSGNTVNAYTVLIVADTETNILTLTNLKLTGYELVQLQDAYTVEGLYPAVEQKLGVPLASQFSMMGLWNLDSNDNAPEQTTEPETNKQPETTKPAQTTKPTTTTKPVTSDTVKVPMVSSNGDAVIKSAQFAWSKVFKGMPVSLTVTLTGDPGEIVILDADGKEVDCMEVSRVTWDGETIVTLVWRVSGASGDAISYTVKAYDADDVAAAKTKTVKVTIQ